MLKPPRSVWVQHLPMASPERQSNPPSPTTQITPVVIAQTRVILKEETESKPLQEQLPVTQIKSEPEDECKPAIAVPPTSAGTNRRTAQTPVVGATILPTVPININLSDLQNVLRRLLGKTNRVVTQGKQGIVVQQPRQQIISLPAFVDCDGTRKIIINYSIRPAAAKTIPAPLPTPTKTEKPSTPEVTDLSIVKAEPESVALDPSLDPPVKLEEPPVDDLLLLLKTYFASNANPGEQELTKISESVSIHVDVVRKWFAKMNSGKNVGNYLRKTTAVSTKTESNASNQNGEAEKDDSKDIGDLVIVKAEPEDPDFVDSQAEQLDLSVPKRIALALETTTPPAKQQQQLLSLTCLKKEQLEGRTIYITTPQTGRHANMVTAAQLRTLTAIAGHGRVRCLSAINTKTKSTILIPELTYATVAGSTTGAKTVILNSHKACAKKADHVGSTAVPAAHRVTESPRPMTAKRRTQPQKRPDSRSDGVPTPEDLAALKKKKKRRQGNGALYPCDLCSKVFNKKFLLLRHKYEHTGKRPHECNISKKAFKHKRQLVDHSYEKPYQCDEDSKRFSHPGSHSGHKREHFSYCRKIRLNFSSSSRPRRVLSKLGSPRPMTAKRRTRPKKRPDSRSDGVPTPEDSAALMKKRRQGNGALYPCDLCSKVFHKKFLLLKHKYEHTGKRPHECNISKKAFKHKQQLVDHSYEKPYQCDEDSKRFSHPGSHSGHMREHFSYCRKIRLNFGSASMTRRVLSKLGSPGAMLRSDSRTFLSVFASDVDEPTEEVMMGGMENLLRDDSNVSVIEVE